MLQAAVGDGLAFDPFAFEEDGLAAPDVDVGRGEIAKALMVAAMIVVLDEGRDLAFEIAGQVVVFQQDAVLQRLMLSAVSACGTDRGYSEREDFGVIVAIRSEDETEPGAGQSAGRADRP